MNDSVSTISYLVIPEPIVIEHWLLRIRSMMGLFVQGCWGKNKGDCDDQVHEAMAAGARTHKPGEIKDSVSIFPIRWLHLWNEMKGSESAVLRGYNNCPTYREYPAWLLLLRKVLHFEQFGQMDVIVVEVVWLFSDLQQSPGSIFATVCRCSCRGLTCVWKRSFRILQWKVCLWWKWKMLNFVFYELLSECN